MNSFKFLFETSPPCIVGYEVLFLCFSFVVPSTSRSTLLDDAVLDCENVQSPVVKMLPGFTFNQEMSTSAIDYSLIPTMNAFLSIALLELFRIARITLHCPFHESLLLILH